MALADLMMAWCAVAPLAGALAVAHAARKGSIGYGAAILVGLVVGPACAWVLWTAFHRLGARLLATTADRAEWRFRALYIAGALWIVTSLVLGGWVAEILLRRM